jgi:hypothetical protein
MPHAVKENGSFPMAQPLRVLVGQSGFANEFAAEAEAGAFGGVVLAVLQGDLRLLSRTPH